MSGYPRKADSCDAGPVFGGNGSGNDPSVSIRYLVTKASGAHSGFQEKLAAAQKAGITACVIGKQEQEQGMSYAQVTETLSRLLGHTISGRPEVEISLIGIGMSAATLTREASAGKVLMWFGAERMLEVVENSRKPIPFYLAKDILPVLRQKESQMDGQKLKVSILFSGDTGFYSGTEKIKTELNKNNYKKIRIFQEFHPFSTSLRQQELPGRMQKF